MNSSDKDLLPRRITRPYNGLQSIMKNYGEILAWFVPWMIPGLLLPGFFMFLPFGALIFPPLAVLTAVLLIRVRRPRGPEVLGILGGVSLWGFAVAYFNRDSNPCNPSGSSVTLQPGESYSCGGVSPEPFLLVGAILLAVAIFGAAAWTIGLAAKGSN
jgi:hypothetical protein